MLHQHPVSFKPQACLIFILPDYFMFLEVPVFVIPFFAMVKCCDPALVFYVFGDFDYFIHSFPTFVLRPLGFCYRLPGFEEALATYVRF